MPLNWMDVSTLSFNTLLLLERVQLSWFPGWVPERQLAIALRANPVVAWYLRHKCPEIGPWLDGVEALDTGPQDAPAAREAEVSILRALEDLIVYAVAPEIYAAQPFLGWDSSELTSLTDFTGKRVLDVGSGTGRLAFAVADKAAAVIALEPVDNLRWYIRDRARAQGLRNIYAVDGLITEIPLPDAFADVTMGGHVFGDDPEAEYRELARATRPDGGMIILCPGNNDRDDARHAFLVARGFAWATFEEPRDGMKRKYWKTLT
ncbi:MAG: methyltransferase domain-containing protein [Anaerolineae bacterium]|nr:methyltransferase domain-containing protein [Anaerolineae bacterium]